MRLFQVPLYIVPPPSAVLYQLWRNLPRIAEYTLVTGGETVGGFLIAVALGVPMALAVAFSRVLRQTLYPAAVTLEMVPKIAFAPLFVTWFGFGYLPKLIIVFLVCFFPILLNGILAFSSLPAELGRLCLLHRRLGLAHLLACPPAGGAAAAVRRHQGGRGQRHGGRHHLRVDRRRRRPRLLHPDRHRRPAHGPGLRHHHRPGPARASPCSAAWFWWSGC